MELEKGSQNNIKHFVYARKSSEREERQILSIESQLMESEDKFGDLETIDILQESASAFFPDKRPVFKEMLRRIDSGEANGIIAWHPNRLSRNEVDAAAITYRLRTGAVKGLKFCSYHFENSPEGIWMLQMALSQSQYDSASKGRDVKRGNKTRFERGQLTSMPPTGYMVNKGWRERGEKRIINDPVRFPLIKKGIGLLLTGNYTAAQVFRTLNNEWSYRTPKGNPLTRSSWYDLLVNPFYYGILEREGEQKIGEHEPMITEDEFWRIQKILGSRGKPQPRTHQFAFSGMLRCANGHLYSFEDKKKYYKETNRTALYTYAYCRGRKQGICDQPSIKLQEVEEVVSNTLSQITIPEEFKNWALKYLNELDDKEVADRVKINDSLQNAYNEADKRLNRLSKHLLSELISEEEYKKLKAELLEERSQIKAKLESTEVRGDNWRELTEKTFVFATYAKYWFESGGLQDKKEILAALGSNLLINNGSLEIELRTPFLELKKHSGELEPLELSVSKGKEGVLEPVNPVWQAREESNL